MTYYLRNRRILSNCSYAVLLVLFSMLESTSAQDGFLDPPSLSSRRLHNVTNTTTGKIVERIWGMSIGKSDCQGAYLEILQNSDEYDKAASSAATTVMTLVPAMLTFAAMPMASIRSLNFINTRLALFTSALTLGLTMTYKKTLMDEKILSVPDLCTPAQIEKYANPGEIKGEHELAKEIEELGALYRGGVGNKKLCALASSTSENKRSIYISLVITASNIAQILLFGTLVRVLPQIENILFIWGCPETTAIIFNSWLSVTAVLSAIIRTIAVSSFTKHDEILHISPIPDHPTENTDTRPPSPCQICSVMHVEVAPVKSSRMMRAVARVGETGRFFFRCRIPRLSFIKMNWLHRTIGRLGQPHPRIVVVRKAHQSNRSGDIKTALDGMIQSASILALTFMFGSIWGGSLEWTVFFVAAFMCVMWISRTVSLVVGRFLETSTGITMITYKSVEEKAAIIRILTGMPEAIIENKSNSSKYWHGHKLRNKCDNCKLPLEDDWEDKTAPGVFYGFIFAIISGVLIFMCFLAVTLPFDAPFIPHPSRWKDFKVANSVSLTLAITYALCVAFEFRSDFISDLIHFEIANGNTRQTRSRDISDTMIV
ncbi:hypothetical protein DFP73DRAFT_348265 [Morchella snyderi]|nr:hypothetical protein DFP73DRAFT_348265 [Morchella snyderi]